MSKDFNSDLFFFFFFNELDDSIHKLIHKSNWSRGQSKDLVV